MNGDPVASLNAAIGQLEAARSRTLESLSEAATTVERARQGRSAAASRELKAAAEKLATAAERAGSVQFHGSYKGTNASFLPAAERRLLSGIAIGAASLLAAWVFLIATLAAAQLEPGQRLALGGTWILIAVVGGFLATSVALAYGFRSVHVSLRSVDGETAEVERSDDVRARRRLERQLAQAQREAERASKRADKSDAESRTARSEARAAERKARDAVAERDRLAATVEGNGMVDKDTASRVTRPKKSAATDQETAA